MSLFRRILKYVWPEMRKNKGALFTVLILFVIRVAIGFTAVPFYFKKIIDTISAFDVDRAAITNELIVLISIIIALELVVVVTARTRQYIYDKFIASVVRNLRNFTFQKIERNSHNFFINTFSGSLVTKARRFVVGFESAMEITIFNFVGVSTILFGVFIFLLFEAPLIAILMITLIAIYLGVVSRIINKKIKYDLLEAEQDSKISGRLADVFGNISAVKFFAAHKDEIESFSQYTDVGKERSLEAALWNRKIEMVQSISSSLIYVIITGVTIYMWVNYKVSTGTVVLVQTYITLTLSRIWELVMSFSRFMKSIPDMKEMVDIFEVIPDIDDPLNPEGLRMKVGHVTFEDVNFKYKNGQEVLSKFNMEIKPGERVGLVGHSGAGKSTITNLILRFIDVESGAIKIDGQDIRNVRQEDLRRFISYVPQESVLFHRTIKENIAYGRPGATDEEIIGAAKKAHAHEFISKLPHGYDTYVGERGVKLSGGERQRVAIARAILKNSPMLILDEATSSLDSVSESFIQDAFNELMKGKTTLVIAHRLSTIQKMDRIIVLDNGNIVEAGSHKELLAKGGLYADLWQHQSGGFLE